MYAQSQISAAILAGGTSSRMGRNKALMVLDGHPLIARVAAPLCDIMQRGRGIGELLLITNTPDEFASLNLAAPQGGQGPRGQLGPGRVRMDWRVHVDVVPGAGPLGGIYTALSYAKFAQVLIVACDLPFITGELVEYLCASSGGSAIFALASEKGAEPLCAVYDKSCLPVIEREILNSRFKVADLYSLLDARVVRLDASLSFYRPNLLVNVNTSEEFAAAEQELGKKESGGH